MFKVCSLYFCSDYKAADMLQRFAETTVGDVTEKASIASWMLHRFTTTVTRVPHPERMPLAQTPAFTKMLAKYEELTCLLWPKSWKTLVRSLSKQCCSRSSIRRRRIFRQLTAALCRTGQYYSTTIRTYRKKPRPSANSLPTSWKAGCHCYSRALMARTPRKQGPVRFERPKVAMTLTHCSTIFLSTLLSK